jgi:hypothetical protein
MLQRIKKFGHTDEVCDHPILSLSSLEISCRADIVAGNEQESPQKTLNKLLEKLVGQS